MSDAVHFMLNDRQVSYTGPGGLAVLEYLREHQRLTGTKEGCGEGECGACTVLLGRLQNRLVRYRCVPSCLLPMAALQGCHLVTVEGLCRDDGLTPVQRALVDEAAVQCGFCTPGMVVSLTGYLLQEKPDLHEAGIREALSGNLCRCTGYASLQRAAHLAWQPLAGLANAPPNTQTGLDWLVQNRYLPAYFLDIARLLQRLPKTETQAENGQHRMIAGGTDAYVQEGETLAESDIEVLHCCTLDAVREEQGYLVVDGLTSFSAFAEHALIRRYLPHITAWMTQIASRPIRNQATLAGNIVNASPIADLVILLLALQADVQLLQDGAIHNLPLCEFYLGYKQRAMAAADRVHSVRFPLPGQDCRIHFEKVAKRKTLDIASVNSTLKIRTDGTRIDALSLSFGGVAPVPLFARRTCAALTGRPLNPASLAQVESVLQDEIAPISDIRGSAAYKRLLARQLLWAHFLELFPEKFPAGEVAHVLA